jgi:hypothetical protein
MRMILLLAGTAMLGACGGAGSQVASAPAPAPSAGNPAGNPHTFVAPSEAKTYIGLGGSQVLEYTIDARECCGQQSQLFAPNATTVRNSSSSISYDPRSAIYTLSVKDPLSGATANTRFQDPASRTDFGGNKEPQWGVPNLNNPNFQYLQAGDGDPRSPIHTAEPESSIQAPIRERPWGKRTAPINPPASYF